jgi:hypothetical protein
VTAGTPEGDRQDPAEQYRVDEAVETTEQEPDAEPAEHSGMETGGEMIAVASDEPVQHEG